MEAYSILIQIIQNPNAIKHYKDLYLFYKKKNKNKESNAIKKLIEKKFNKNVDY